MIAQGSDASEPNAELCPKFNRIRLGIAPGCVTARREGPTKTLGCGLLIE
jgi:hypothetical protein